MTPTNIPDLITQLRDYQLALDANVVICDRRVVDQSAEIMTAMAAHIAMMEHNITALEVKSEQLREVLAKAANFVEALADNDPDEPVADNGMTVLAHLQFDAPALAWAARHALGEQP